MNSIIGQGSTPYLQLLIEGCDLSNAAVVVFSIEQGKTELTLTGDRVTVTTDSEDSVVTAHLTQEETLRFKQGTASLQVRWRNPDNEAYVTEKARINFFESLYQEVI